MVDVPPAKPCGALNVASITLTYNPDGSVSTGLSHAPGAADDMMRLVTTNAATTGKVTWNCADKGATPLLAQDRKWTPKAA